MEGQVRALSVGWTVDTPDGIGRSEIDRDCDESEIRTAPRRTLISLAELRRHCRSERVEDLLDDLTMLCGDVQDARDGVTIA
jgi:hypothetical protein